jgi:hypothetical protein
MTEKGHLQGVKPIGKTMTRGPFWGRHWRNKRWILVRQRGTGETACLPSPYARSATRACIVTLSCTVSSHKPSEGSFTLTLTRRLLQAAQPEWDLVCLLRFREDTPFISDRSGGGPVKFDEGVTRNIDSSAFGASL